MLSLMFCSVLLFASVDIGILFYAFCRVPVSCSKLALEKPSSLRQALIRYISEAMEHAPSIIIFDDLDSIIASSSESDGSQPSSSSTALVQFFADIMDEYEVKINFVCVCVYCSSNLVCHGVSS